MEHIENWIPKMASSSTGFWSRLDAHVERIGDSINPILVKEARQALKSKQFTITFGLLLISGWIWSLVSSSLMAERIQYSGAAVPTFVGYFVILVFPVLVIVPFAAFLSLVAERDEGTYELLSITSLSSGQIVRGKLASAILQMLVYFSALAPCIVFTYLLRGLDIVTIAFVLMYTFVASLVLSALGLLIATLTRAAHARVLLSGVFIIALFLLAWGWLMFIGEEFLRRGAAFDDPEFWILNVALLTGLGSFLALFTSAASAQISFASDNRSTRVRRIMLVQQTLLIGWMAYFMTVYPDDEVLFVAITLAGIYWAITGALMTGELAELSPRVKRSLPSTALGRVFLTWFNPGSGTGYVFAVSNLLTCLLALGIYAEFFLPPIDLEYWWYYALAIVLYVTIYLGVGRLLILFVRRYARFSATIGLLIQAVIAGFGGLIPATLQLSMYRVFGDDYTMLQIPNWGWTLAEFMDTNGYFAGDRFLIVVILAGVSVPILLVNLAVAAKEVAATRIAVPQRVVAEIQETKHGPKQEHEVQLELVSDSDALQTRQLGAEPRDEPA